MKKVMYIIGIGLILGSGYVVASNVGPYSYDERGAQITTGLGIAGLTASKEATTPPAYVGEMIYCTNCTNWNNGLGGICISTGTGTGAFIAISSNTAVTACQ